jgi:hypothetical protein
MSRLVPARWHEAETSVAVARCSSRLRWARPLDQRYSCRLAAPLGALEGPRPSPAAVARLKDSLANEGTALLNLRSVRRAVNQAIRLARSEGASYTAIAAAIVPGSGDVAKTTAARERMAANLRGRLWEERRRGVGANRR